MPIRLPPHHQHYHNLHIRLPLNTKTTTCVSVCPLTFSIPPLPQHANQFAPSIPPLLQHAHQFVPKPPPLLEYAYLSTTSLRPYYLYMRISSPPHHQHYHNMCISSTLTITTNTTCVSVSWVFLTALQIILKSKEKLLFDKERNEISTFSLLLFRRQPTRQNFSYDHETLSELKVQ